MLIMGVAVTGGGVRLESFLLPLLAITVLAGFIHPRNGERLGHELQTFLLVLTILTGLYLWNGWGGRFTDFIGDGRLWLEAAQEIAAGEYFLDSPQERSYLVAHLGVPYVYGGVLMLGMGNIYSLIVMHALIIVLSANLMYKIGERVLDVRAAQLAYWMIALHPEVLAWSSILIRESLSVFLILAFFYSCMRFVVDESLPHGLYLVATLLATYFIRASMVFGLIAIGLVCAGLVMIHTRRFVIPALTCAGLIAIGVGLTMVPLTGDPRVAKVVPIVLSGIKGSVLFKNVQFGNVSIVRDLLGEQFTLMKFYLWPLWTLAYWIYPFPRLLSGIGYVNPMVIIVENMMGVVNFVLIPFLLYGVWQITRNPRMNRLMLIAGAAIMATGMILAGPFILGRYRLVAMPFFMLLSAYGLTQIDSRKRLVVIALMPLAMVGFWWIYMVTKLLLA